MGRLYNREGSKNYWLAYRDAKGKLIRRSSKTTEKSLAEDRLAEIEAKIRAEAAGAPSDDHQPAVAGPEEPQHATGAKSRPWEVIVREWRSGGGKHRTDIGTEVEIVSAPDRAMAMAIAKHMIQRHGRRATSGTELEVSIAAPAPRASPDDADE